MYLCYGNWMCLHPVHPQKGCSQLCLVRGGNRHSVLSLTVELTVGVLIISTGLRSDSYLALFKAGSFVFHIDDYYVSINRTSVHLPLPFVLLFSSVFQMYLKIQILYCNTVIYRQLYVNNRHRHKLDVNDIPTFLQPYI